MERVMKGVIFAVLLIAGVATASAQLFQEGEVLYKDVTSKVESIMEYSRQIEQYETVRTELEQKAIEIGIPMPELFVAERDCLSKIMITG